MEKEIEKMYENPDSVSEKDLANLVKTILALSKGEIRIAEQKNDWMVNEWIMKAIMLFFKFQNKITNELPKYQSFNAETKIRQLPQSLVRAGSFIGKGCILMPSLVNIGAYVDEGTMVDTWATVGSGAQIGKNVHISGGVGIGGILEPQQEKVVVVGDNCFVGSRCILTEGVVIGANSILASNVNLNPSIKIFDTKSGKKIELEKGKIPPNSVVVPSMYRTKLDLYRPCVEIIKEVDFRVTEKTKLNQLLRTI